MILRARSCTPWSVAFQIDRPTIGTIGSLVRHDDDARCFVGRVTTNFSTDGTFRLDAGAKLAIDFIIDFWRARFAHRVVDFVTKSFQFLAQSLQMIFDMSELVTPLLQIRGLFVAKGDKLLDAKTFFVDHRFDRFGSHPRRRR